MSNTLTIRTVESGDLPAIADLWCALQRAQEPHHPRWSVSPRQHRRYLEDLGELVGASGHVHRVVVESTGRPVGFCHGEIVEPPTYDAEDRIGRITAIFVDPAVRDAGIGSALVSAVVEALESDGATRIEATISAENDGAIRFFERARFSLLTVTLTRES